MHATLFSSWCRDAKISFWNPTAQTQSFDTQIFTTSTRAHNQVQRTQVSNFKSTQREMQVDCVFFPLATVSRAYWVQKSCAACCLFETHNQGKFTLLSHEEARQRQIKAAHLTVHAGIAAPLSVLWTVVPKQAHHQLPCGESYHFLVYLPGAAVTINDPADS